MHRRREAKTATMTSSFENEVRKDDGRAGAGNQRGAEMMRRWEADANVKGKRGRLGQRDGMTQR